jgi:hypothetical protein
MLLRAGDGMVTIMLSREHVMIKFDFLKLNIGGQVNGNWKRTRPLLGKLV